MARDIDAQLLDGGCDINRVIVLAESGSESLCQTRIALEHNDGQGLHTASLRPVIDGRGGCDCRALRLGERGSYRHSENEQRRPELSRSWFPAGLRLKGDCLQLAVLLQKDFHFAFRLFQFLTTGGGKLHAFLEQG